MVAEFFAGAPRHPSFTLEKQLEGHEKAQKAQKAEAAAMKSSDPLITPWMSLGELTSAEPNPHFVPLAPFCGHQDPRFQVYPGNRSSFNRREPKDRIERR